MEEGDLAAAALEAELEALLDEAEAEIEAAGEDGGLIAPPPPLPPPAAAPAPEVPDTIVKCKFGCGVLSFYPKGKRFTAECLVAAHNADRA